MDYGKKMRVGGFNLLKYKKDDMSFIRVSTIMGNWAMEYREDSILYQWLDCDRTEEQDEALHVLFVNSFMVGSFLEAEFQHDVVIAAGKFQERINAEAPEVSEEEDAEALNEMRLIHEMDEERQLIDVKIQYEVGEALKEEQVNANSVNDVYEKIGATLDDADLEIPTNGNVEATEAWSVESGEDFDLKV